jgi:hypothetical protein
MTAWLLLHYTLPAQPSALRVYIWRKLKRLGAILLNESVWVLPDTPRTAEQFQWLAVEIHERGGEGYLWRSTEFFEGQGDAMVDQFAQQADSSYKELLKKMRTKNPDVAEFSRRYQQIAATDYFHSILGQQVRQKLLSLRGKKA